MTGSERLREMAAEMKAEKERPSPTTTRDRAQLLLLEGMYTCAAEIVEALEALRGEEDRS